MAPGNEKRIFAFPGYQGTEIITADGVFRSPGLISEPMLLAAVINQFINPMAAEDKTAGFKPTARTMELGGVTLPCIMLAKSNTRVANQPIGFYPSWCTEPGKDTLRVFVDDGGIAIIRNGISSFQGKDIPTDVKVTFNGTVIGTGRMEAISLDGMPTAPFTPDRDMAKALPKPIELKGKKLEGQAEKHTDPDFLPGCRHARPVHPHHQWWSAGRHRNPPLGGRRRSDSRHAARVLSRPRRRANRLRRGAPVDLPPAIWWKAAPCPSPEPSTSKSAKDSRFRASAVSPWSTGSGASAG